MDANAVGERECDSERAVDKRQRSNKGGLPFSSLLLKYHADVLVEGRDFKIMRQTMLILFFLFRVQSGIKS